MDKKYNGWTNYGTWVCNLWLTNDETTYNEARSLKTVEELKQFVEEKIINIGEASLRSDLLNASFKKINFQEVFESFKE